jgi:hypothetical protein
LKEAILLDGPYGSIFRIKSAKTAAMRCWINESSPRNGCQPYITLSMIRVSVEYNSIKKHAPFYQHKNSKHADLLTKVISLYFKYFYKKPDTNESAKNDH